MVKKTVKLLITGVPSTGKTTLARAWCEKSGFPALSLNDLVEEKKLFSEIDETDMAKVVRLGALLREANAWLSRQAASCIVEGHLGCEIKLKVDRVAVLRLHPQELEARLRLRGYVPGKIYANKMSELLDYCTIRSLKNYPKSRVYEIDLTGRLSPEQSFEDLGNIFAGTSAAAKLRPRVDWSSLLFEEKINFGQ